MNKCLLCKQNIADKTGSHIIPSFLMKRINGNGMRDHEIGFVIKKCNVDTYFGRDIYEDERKSTKKKFIVEKILILKIVFYVKSVKIILVH